MIIEVLWTDDIDDKLKVSAGEDLAFIKNQVKQKIAQLWRCEKDNHLCYVVTRIDRTGKGYELCLVLGEGSGFYLFAPEFLAFAKRNNIPLRTHVKRKGMIRMWEKLGVYQSEYILRSE